MQFLLGVTLPNDDAIEKAILLRSNQADPLKWLNQLKILFPELKMSLACIPNHGSILPLPSRVDSRNRRVNAVSRAPLLDSSEAVEAMPRGSGLCGLSSRQQAAVGLLSRGYSYRQIAVSLGLSVSTVRTHLHTAYEKLGAKSGGQAVAKMFQELRKEQTHRWTETNNPQFDDKRCLA